MWLARRAAFPATVSTCSLSCLNPAGFFDIYPLDNARAFNGAWSVYPFFPSGVVAVSGIEQGLFLLDPAAVSPTR